MSQNLRHQGSVMFTDKKNEILEIFPFEDGKRKFGVDNDIDESSL